jgi:hypothetical protein
LTFWGLATRVITINLPDSSILREDILVGRYPTYFEEL